jgi:hypothetical protein
LPTTRELIDSVNTSAFPVTNLGLGAELWIGPYQNWVDDKPITVTSQNGAVGLFARTALDESDACATDSCKGDSDQVGNNSFDGTTKVISNPLDHQGRMVMRDFAAPTAKCATREPMAATTTAG